MEAERGAEVGAQGHAPEHRNTLGIGRDTPPRRPHRAGGLADGDRGRRCEVQDDHFPERIVRQQTHHRFEPRVQIVDVADEGVDVHRERGGESKGITIEEREVDAVEMNAPRQRVGLVEVLGRGGDVAAMPACDPVRGVSDHQSDRVVDRVRPGEQLAGNGFGPSELAAQIEARPLRPQEVHQLRRPTEGLGELPAPHEERRAVQGRVPETRSFQGDQLADRAQFGCEVVVTRSDRTPELHGPFEKVLGRRVGEAQHGDVCRPLQRGRSALGDADRRSLPEMLSKDFGGVVAVVERVGDLEVQAGPAQRGQVLDDDFADERVYEPIHTRPVDDRHEQPLPEGRLEVVEALFERQARRASKQAHFDVATDDGSDLEQPARRLGDLRETASHHIANPRRDVGESLAGRDEPCHLRDEERVPTGALEDAAEQDVVRRRTGGQRDQFRCVRSAQTTKAQPARARQPRQRGQRVDDVVVAADLQLANGADDQYRGVAQATGEGGEEFERCNIGPLHVVEDEHDGLSSPRTHPRQRRSPRTARSAPVRRPSRAGPRPTPTV